MKRIAVWRTGHIGDMVCALPAITALRRACSPAAITVLTDRDGAGRHVAERCAAVDEVVAYAPGRRLWGGLPLGLIRYLREARFDALVHLAQDRATGLSKLRDLVVCRIGGVSRTAGFEWRGTYWLRARRRLIAPAEGVWPNEVQRLLTVLEASGVAAGPVGFGLASTEADRLAADGLWAEFRLHGAGPIVAMAPLSRMPAKQWPVDRFAAVAEHLVRRAGAVVAVVGSDGDRDSAEAIRRQVEQRLAPGAARSPAVVNLCGRTDIGACIEVLRRSSLYVGNDTGPMHLAAAVGTPCVAIFSDRDLPGAWAPYGGRHVVLRSPVACGGCLAQACPHGEPRCLTGIGVDEVVREALGALGRVDARCTSSHRLGAA